MFDYVKSIKSRAQECTPHLFEEIIDSEAVSGICAEIADARELCLHGEMQKEDFKTLKAEKKKLLPGFNFQAHYINGGRRLDKNAVRSGLCIYDKDHVSDPEGWFRQFVEPHVKEWQVVLAHVTPSLEGVRLVFRIAKDAEIADAQYSMARALGDEDYDGSVKDMARISFAVPRTYIIFIDNEGLFIPTADDYKMPFEMTRNHAKAEKPKTAAETPSTRWKCKKPTERTLAIAERAMQKRGITKKSLSKEGQRHFMLANLLSSGITRLLTKEELMGVIKKTAPGYVKEDDCWRLVADWYRNYRNNDKPVSQDMAWTFADVLNDEKKDTSPAKEEVKTEPAKDAKPDFCMNADELPIGLKESISGAHEGLAMPILCAIMPLAGAYADQVTARYADGKLQHLGLMSIIIGEQASKKSICKDTVDIWKMAMHDDDMAQRKIEDEWKQRRKNRKANEKGEPDPQVLIREIPVTTSCSTLLKRLKNSREHCLYSFGEELDTLKKTNGAGSWSSKYDVYRLSFDRGEWGQDYNSDQAESGIVDVAYNWTILGTYGALKRCFQSDNVENGLSSRMMIAEMPDNRFAKMTTFDDLKSSDNESIQKAVDTLRSKTGFIDTPKLRAAMAEWVEEKRVVALQAIDEVMDTYRKRAAVIAFRCGVIFSILAGEETDACLTFARMMAEYVLKEQCKLFGGNLKDERQSTETHDHNANILSSLPEHFGMDDIRAMKGRSYSDDTLRQTICRWRRDGWIEKISRGTWKKIPQADACAALR